MSGPIPVEPPQGPEPTRPPLTARRAIVIVLAYFAAQFVAGIAVMIAVTGYYTPRIADSAEVARRIRGTFVLPAALLGFVLGGLAVLRLTRRMFAGSPRAEAFATLALTRPRRRDVLAGTALGLGLAFLYAWVAITLAPQEPAKPWGPLVSAASEGGWRRGLWAVLALFLAPPIEEFLFRGVLFGGLARDWGTWGAAVAVTLLFALLHLTETGLYWPAILAVTTLAAVTMAARIRTRSLGTSVAVHAAYNAGLVLLVYLGSG
jgi:membrane protease YdiL (CAAX protease family)